MSGVRSNNIEVVVRNDDESTGKAVSRDRSPHGGARNGGFSVGDKRGGRMRAGRTRPRVKQQQHNNSDRGGFGPNCVHVSNIPYDYRWQGLKDIFRKNVGEVVRVRLHTDDGGVSRGSAIVEMRSAELASRAIAKMHRFELAGRNLVVRSANTAAAHDDRRMLNGGGTARQSRVDALLPGCVDGMLSGEMVLVPPPALASVVDPIVVRGLPDGGTAIASGGSSMVLPLLAPPQSQQQQQQQQQLPLAARIPNTYGLSVQFLQSLGIDGPLVDRVFVANLDYKVTEEQLREVFNLAGRVLDVQLRVDREGNSRGHGTVRFSHPVEAVQAVSMLHNQIYMDRKLTVRLDRAVASGGLPDRDSDPADTSVLPAGLASVGCGLGAHGTPLTDVSRRLQESAANQQSREPSTSLLTVPQQSQSLLPASLFHAPATIYDAPAAVGDKYGAAPASSASILSVMPPTQPQYGSVDQAVMHMTSSAAAVPPPSMTSLMTSSLAHRPSVNGMSSDSGYMGVAPSLSDRHQLHPNSAERPGYSAPPALGTSLLPNPSTVDAPARAVIVRNLDPSYTSRRLHDKYSEIGVVQYVDILSPGVGVVHFDRSADMERALTLTHGCRLDGRILDVRPY